MSRRRIAATRPRPGLVGRATKGLRRLVASGGAASGRARRASAGSTRRSRAAARRARENLRRSIDQWAVRTSERLAGRPGVGLIGLDVNRTPSRLRTRSWVPLVAAGIAGALFLAGLRMDVIRMRFALAQAFEEELRLEQLKRDLTVEMRRLRDPSVLARRAEELGFRRAERMIDLAPGEPVDVPRAPTLEAPMELAARVERDAPGRRP